MKKVSKYIIDFLYNEENSFNLFKFIFKLPFILVSYTVIFFTKTKRALYKYSCLFKIKDPGIFTISIGNINLGGAGKTPFSYTIAEYLYKLNLKPCIISRGYKGHLKKKPILQVGNMRLKMPDENFRTK